MADPDIRRMGKKHKKHKKEHSQYQSYRLPGFLPERVPMPEEPDEMKVVLRLPRPMENHNGKLRFAPSSGQRHRDNRHSGGSHHPPRELTVSIPLEVLDQSTEQMDDVEKMEEEEVPAMSAIDHQRRSHKHKKHKKHKKHHHHDSAHLDGGHHAPPTTSAMTVAPLRIHVPKPVENKTPSKHKSHLYQIDGGSSLSLERRGQPPEGGVLSGKHMLTHKHHHKHKEKRHDHSRRKPAHQGSSEFHVSGDEINDQGPRVINIVPPRIPGGKPTSFLMKEEEKKVSNIEAESSVGDRQQGAHDSHKHHKKKKKKHHKHSKLLSESEVSPTVFKTSDADTDDSRRGIFTTPLPGGKRNLSQTHVQEPLATLQDTSLSGRESDLSRPSSGKKGSRRTSLESPDITRSSSARETLRLSQDGDSSHIPLRRLSKDSRTAKSLAQDAEPPPSKRVKVEAVKSSPSPLLESKMDISLTRNFDDELRFQHTPSPTVDVQFMSSSKQHHVSSDPLPIGATNSALIGGSATPLLTKPAVDGGRPSTGEKTFKSTMTPPSPAASTTETKTPQVRLSKDTLQLFLKNLHHLIQRRDPEGIFAEPVTDDIAPGYSALIPIPMDLTTMSTKIDMGQYSSVTEFKGDFILMCNNAMTYNAPETVYYASAKRLLTTGLQIIAKETSLRPDIRHGTTAPIASRSASPAPLLSDSRVPTPTVNIKVDYSSPFLCRFDLSVLRGASTTSSVGIGLVGGALIGEQMDHVSVDVGGVSEVLNQSHLTKVVVGVEEEKEEEEEEGDEVEDVLASVPPESPEEILMQVEEAAETMKENLDANRPHVKFSFLNQDDSGKTMLNILNPDTGTVDLSNPLDLTSLGDYVRMGTNAATVLKTELPLMRATPVSYLMYGPFGSFAPAYDSSFATLSKMDSDLLLQSYGSELGVSYAHSLQQFVKGAGSYVTEMANAVLNGLTNNRHSKFMSKFREFEERERKLREGSSDHSTDESKDDEEKKSTHEREGSVSARSESGQSEREEKRDDDDQQMDTTETPPTPVETPPTLEDSHGSSDFSSSNSKRESIANDNSRDSSHSKEEEEEDENVLVASLETEDGNYSSTIVHPSGGSKSMSLSGKPELSSLSREASLGLSDQVSLERASTPGEETMEDGGEVKGDGEVGGEEAVKMAAVTGAGLDELEEEEEEVGSTTSSDSGDSSDDNSSSSSSSRESSPEPEEEPLQKLTGERRHDEGIDSQLAHTSDLLGRLHDEQKDRLSQEPVKLDDGHLVLPGPSDEEMKLASELRAGLVQLTAQARPRDVVSVPALHDAMGITLETVTTQDQPAAHEDSESSQTALEQTKSEHTDLESTGPL